ncbi:slit homolog 3 protein-like [Ostrea edulis]|uniref:slit homolog 3 protein-like n=1 Tax=Ostrea edulis TaxID=37623 RepID=UPI0024AF76DF|nr:slit homolog 3 protein-like [Ostrea edulis]XP_056012720.1 slit homolog 3 protein-like [Ostrea edulis]XP_056012721.1 slit homolog 3 protein-like [Ostrea edulis]XP_056012722.1 slit homolog 3 protein-like [Ostrea edulis]XP_056012723.1 slit homolog 3 protein-like [Ostrea edulis]
MNLNTALMLWCIFLVGLVGVAARGCGDGYCKCSHVQKRATCTSKKKELSYFPELPPYIKQLTYRDNYLPHLTRDMLINLTKINLEQLYLIDNGIFKIDSNTFKDLKKLVKLEISRDAVLNGTVVANAIHSVSRSFERLVLQHNKWETIPLNMFDGLQGSNISYIDLSYNKLQSFNGTQILRLIPYVKTLILDDNPISESNIDFHNMPQMFKLSLENTYLQKVPVFCDVKGSSLLPRLRSLYLGHTSIRSVSMEDFTCLPYLWKLSLLYTNIRVIPNNTFAALPELQTLILENIITLRRLEYFAFNSTSLKKLQFGYIKFKFDDKGRYNNDLFKFAPSLRDLDLSNNQISIGAILKTLLWNLVRLQKLNLQGCGLNYLARGTFDRMPNLHTIIMKGNNLNGWDPNMFKGLVNLKKLYIAGNNIAVVNKTSLEFTTTTALQEIDLSNNPFSCTCQLLWFRDWLKSTKNVTVPLYPERYVCRSPPTWDKKLLASFNYTAEDCKEKNPWIWIGSLLGSFAFLCIVLIIIIYRQLATVRNFIYLMRLRRKGYVRLVNSAEYIFDCYIISCEADESWVLRTLVPKLEEEHCISACVPSRDFDIGAPFVDQILEKMQDSKKIIIVMSNEFTQDEWCQFQVEKAQERIRNQGIEAAVLIMLHDIDNKHMTSTIKELLRKNSYATWVSGRIGKQLFWNIVLAAIEKPFGNPPVAVS